MRIWEIRNRTPELLSKLTEVWESSARATNSFLSEPELLEIKREVPDALRGVGRLFAAENKDGAPRRLHGCRGVVSGDAVRVRG